MPQPTDFPPTSNSIIPNLDKKVERALRDIARIDGVPVFRVVWGQDPRVTYTYHSERHLTYRSHIHHEQKLGKPKYDMETGRPIGYEKVYDLYAILAPAELGLLEAVTVSTDIGINRWFLEFGQLVDEDQWEADRWTDETGQTRLDDNGNPYDYLGEYPEGGVDYTLLRLIATHDGCCKLTNPNGPQIGTKDDGTPCFGFRREPSMFDVQYARKCWDRFQSQPRSYGLRDAVPEHLVVQGIKDKYGEFVRQRRHEDDILRENIRQELLPHRRRIIDGGHGLDLHTFHFVPGNYKRKETNA